jgi:hypothetical protein
MTKPAALLFSRFTGGLGRPLTGDSVWMPAYLELRGSRLLYSTPERTRRVDPSRLLDQFIALSDQSSTDRDILAFARRYGPLYICEHHGIAIYHKPLLMSRIQLGPAPIFGVDEPFKYIWCGPKAERRNPATFSEPVEGWRKLASRAANLLVVANEIRLNGDVPPRAWEKVDGSGEFGKLYPSLAYLDEPWFRLAANVEYWLAAAEVDVRVSVEGQSLVASLNSFMMSSLALVAIQLLLAITRSEGLTTCSGCGAPFISNRRPLAGKVVGRWVAKRNYCQTCREAKVPQRDAARDYRARKAHSRILN